MDILHREQKGSIKKFLANPEESLKWNMWLPLKKNAKLNVQQKISQRRLKKNGSRKQKFVTYDGENKNCKL